MFLFLKSTQNATLFHYVLKIISVKCDHYYPRIVEGVHKKSATFCEVLVMRGRPVDFRFIADPVALKLVTHNKIMFRAGTGSCLPR